MILFYDLETTGLPRGDEMPGITQIGAVLFDDYIIGTFNEMVNPELPHDKWEAGAIKATGISPETVKNAQSFFTVGKMFAEFATGAHTLSGYNITNFDNLVLQAQLVRYGMEFNFPWPPKHVDVAQVAKATGRWMGKRGPKFPKLSVLYQDLTGQPLENAHEALADVHATVACYQELMK